MGIIFTKGTKFAGHGRVYKVTSRRKDGLYNAKIVTGPTNKRTGKRTVTGIPTQYIKQRLWRR